MYLNEADIMSRQLDEDNSFGSRSILFRAHALVLSKQHKTFKRDLKPTGLSPEQMTTYEFFRANLEYLKVTIWLKNMVDNVNIRFDVAMLN